MTGGILLKDKEIKVGQIRKKEIRDAAMRCFLNKGFQNTTMEDVIKEVGMSTGGVYHHYKSTAEMLKDLMLDGNQYRNNLIDNYLEAHIGQDKYEQMSEILVDKCLPDTDITKVYSLLLQSKKYNEDLEKMFQDLKTETVNQLDSISNKLGIDSKIFEDGFLVNYINGMILSSQVLNARDSYDENRKYLKDTILNYILDLEKIDN